MNGLRTLALVCVASLATSGVRAQDPQVTEVASPLARLDAAAERLDFPAVLAASEEAIATGQLDPAELVHVFRQAAMAESFAGNALGARSAYERMLAIEPEAQPDESVPPRLQPPYVEALRARDRIRVSASLTTAGHAVHVRIEDGVGVISEVVFTYDLGLGTEPTIAVAAPSADVVFQIPESVNGTIRYHVTMRDRFGNRWFELGSSDDPRLVSITSSPLPDDDRPAPTRRRLVRSPWLWVGVGVLAVGLGVGIGVARDRTIRAVTSVTF
jgi:hypothetical protein